MGDNSETLDVPSGVADGNFGWENDAKILGEGVDESLEQQLKDDKEPKAPEKDEKEERVDEKDEKEEIEEKIEEEPDPKRLGPPIFKDIEKQFPEFFKKFPEVRAAIASDREYTRLFGSVASAKDAHQELGAFRGLQTSLFKGNATHLVESMVKTDQGATAKFAKAILPALFKVNPSLFEAAWVPSAKNLIRQMHEHGVSTKNDNIKHSAEHLAAYLFGKPDIPEEEREEPEKIDPEREKLERERSEYAAQKYEDFSSSVYEAAGSFLTKEIKAMIPEDEFSDFVRTKMVSEIIERANNIVREDTGHISRMTDLWNRAVANNYKGNWKNDIVVAYVKEMRRYIDSVRRKVVAEASGKKPKGEEEPTRRRAFVPRGANPGEKRIVAPEKSSERAKFYREHSDLDIIKGA